MNCPLCHEPIDPRRDEGEVVRPGPRWRLTHARCWAAYDDQDESDSLTDTHAAALLGEPAQEIQ